jgi:hypothetical protein
VNKTVRRALPYAGTIVIFVLIFWRIPVAAVGASLRGTPVLKFVALFLPFSSFYWIIDSLCLAWVVNRFNTAIALRDIMPVRASMYVLSLLNSNLGQGGVAWYLHRKTGVPFLEMLGSIVFIGLMEMYQLLFFSTLGVLFYRPETAAQQAVVHALRYADIGGWILLVVLIGYFGGMRRRKRIANWIAVTRARAIVSAFVAARPLDYAIVLAIKSPAFMVSLLTQYYALHLFHISIPLIKLILFLPLVYLAAALPVSVAHLGTSQAAWLLFFNGSAPDAQILAYSLAAHFTFMFCNALIGLCFLPRASRELTEVEIAPTAG